MLSLFWVQNHKCRSARPVNVHIIRSQKKPTWEHCNVFHQGKAITLHKKLVLVILRSTCTLRRNNAPWGFLHFSTGSYCSALADARKTTSTTTPFFNQWWKAGEERRFVQCLYPTWKSSKAVQRKKNKKFLTFFTWRSPKVSPAETFERSDCLRS